MHITDSTLSLGAQHRLETSTTQESLAVGGVTAAKLSFGSLFDSKLIPLPDTTTQRSATTEQNDTRDALNKILQSLLNALFGESESVCKSDKDTSLVDIKAADTSSRNVPRPLQFSLVQTREEESCSFSANGNICLADGSSRQFDVSYQMQRSEESTRLDFGGPLHDPLVLDQGAPSSKLSDFSVDFDLDSDGKTESMRMPDVGSSLLFLDRNQNGKADDGSELFGPQSGDGFADLAMLDSDGNHWIDSADAVYADLKLWSMDGEGKEHIESLADAGIGALATASAVTPFSIKEHGQVIGQVRASSVWLGEQSGAGTVRQIDVATGGSQNA